MNVLFHVQHLLGIGHVRRAALIARALIDAGAAVTVAQGGFPVPGADFGRARVVQLPPARAADASFRPILDEAGRPVDDAWKRARAAALLALHDALQPDVLVIETFPFGRKAFQFELHPLLEAASARQRPPLVVSSVRDILVGKREPQREAAMAATARRFFDRVLVHGDPNLIPFSATFPHADAIEDLIEYTGYVSPAPPAPSPGTDGTGEVIVSVGGGAVGGRLLRTALAARALSGLAAAPWRLLVGPDVPAPAFGDLRRAAPAGVIVERARRDFPALLGRCRLSISQAGYNTVMDVLTAGCRSVMVPFASDGQTEQAVRAGLLAERGLTTVVNEAGLTPESLAAGIDAALGRPVPPPPPLALDGAAETARLIERALAARGSTGKDR